MPVIVQADDLPVLGSSGFKEICETMYAARNADEDWPAWSQGAQHHCTLRTKDVSASDMNADDYAWALRKSLTFACKGKREVIYEVVRRLKDCGGETRTFVMQPIINMPGACRVSFVETSEMFDVAPALIEDLVDWREDMPWYERILVNLFAPRELPMVMDGLIACAE